MTSRLRVDRLRIVQIKQRAAFGQGRQNERIAAVRMRMATLADLSHCHGISKFSELYLSAVEAWFSMPP